MMRLHRWLLDSYKRDGSFSLGKAVVGYATLVMAIILISGLVIWYPRNKKVLKNRLKIKPNPAGIVSSTTCMSRVVSTPPCSCSS